MRPTLHKLTRLPFLVLLAFAALGCLPPGTTGGTEGNEDGTLETPSTDPTERPSTDPTQPPSTDPTQPPSTDPTEPPIASPQPAPNTDPTEPPIASPQPAPSDPVEPPVVDPVEPAPANPVTPNSVTVAPKRIDDVLTNPGMGFANFHFGWWCDLPPNSFALQACAQRVQQNWPENYPETGTAYFRWHWRDLEPERGKIDFDMIDAAIQSANLMGMTLSFRVMTVDEGRSGVPDWLTSAPYDVAGQWRPGSGGNTFWPDYRDAAFQSEHARLIEALGNRYDGHPAVDHVDIGTVGCWGEWNTACLQSDKGIVDVYEPTSSTERQQIKTALTQLIDHHLSAFGSTPVVMLGTEGDEVDLMVHATQGGAGWRVDCWGDWGMWGDAWSHQDDLYPSMISVATALDPGFAEVWKHAPVQLEVCGTLPGWLDRGWSASEQNGEVQKSFDWALEQHSSVLNAKSTDIPSSYVAAIDELLKQNGYRFVIDRFTHDDTVQAGSSTTFTTDWSNLGVAPHYLPRTLAYRLRDSSTETTVYSKEDTRNWLPGSWTVSDSITIPADLPKGTYEIDIALLDRDGKAPLTQALPPLHLGIDGRSADGWYSISELTVE